ncbi:MAG: CBS domain-containing protein [Deltaproteobacteria bacterium]|nr:CBS domain-containing protein [Deltaproteobacteria bacterium]
MSRVKVRDLMTTEVVTVGANETLDAAEQLMLAARIHHLPVVTRSKKLLGLVTQADLLRAQVSIFAEVSPAEEASLMEAIPVAQVMTTAVCTIAPEDTAEHAARVMKRSKFGCLPVVVEGVVVGIVTEGDFVELAARALEAQTGDLLSLGEDTRAAVRGRAGAPQRHENKGNPP